MKDKNLITLVTLTPKQVYEDQVRLKKECDSKESEQKKQSEKESEKKKCEKESEKKKS